MNKNLFKDANQIIDFSINASLPNVKKALNNFSKPKGRTIMIAIGKAAYTMASETISQIDIDEGLVITKYSHLKSSLKNTTIIEAGHPILDENSLLATSKTIQMCSNLTKDDVILFLISGGGSSLFELPLINLDKLQAINKQLINCGASINEINIIRNRLSKVKGGKFAKLCEPAKIINIILSDVIGDSLNIIASGPTNIDPSTPNDALKVIKKYNLNLDNEILELLQHDTIKELNNVENHIIGNNDLLVESAKTKAKFLGYQVIPTKQHLTCDINEAVLYFSSFLNNTNKSNSKVCIIIGGEISINVKGNGLGGRNQEFACRMAPLLINTNACFFALGSDGTDGPTNAAGGYVDKDSYDSSIDSYLKSNDSYHYLEKNNGLIITGPTLTNVCDLYCLLINNLD